MKINREKLNTLLKSGLNPEVKTRKQLAEKLELDPTSLTRWFATRDRLGNPRYPVVPDRHLNNILQIFNLTAECFALEDEGFHRYCFELAAQRQDADLAHEKKLLTRQDRVERRRLSIPMSPMRKRRVAAYSLSAALVMCLIFWLVWYWQPEVSDAPELALFEQQEDCWSGFAANESEFNYKDASDPCHYRKLMHRALAQLKAQNREQTGAREVTVDATGDYIAFLSEKLQQRHELEKVILHYELGRSEFLKGNYPLAVSHLKAANQTVSSLSNVNTELKQEINAFLERAEQAFSIEKQSKN